MADISKLITDLQALSPDERMALQTLLGASNSIDLNSDSIDLDDDSIDLNSTEPKPKRKRKKRSEKREKVEEDRGRVDRRPQPQQLVQQEAAVVPSTTIGRSEPKQTTGGNKHGGNAQARIESIDTRTPRENLFLTKFRHLAPATQEERKAQDFDQKIALQMTPSERGLRDSGIIEDVQCLVCRRFFDVPAILTHKDMDTGELRFTCNNCQRSK